MSGLPHPIDIYVGKELLNIRKKRGFSQEILADHINISRQQIQKYETGITRVPISTLHDICEVCHISIKNFFEGIDEYQKRNISKKSDILDQARMSPLHILIVEDSTSDELLTREAINQSIIVSKTYTVKDGVEALSFLRDRARSNIHSLPDIVLLDLNIPKKDGIETLKEIKNDAAIKTTSVVVITNSVSAIEMRTAYKYGASGFVVKSFNPEEYFNKIKLVVEYWANMALPTM